MPEPSFKSFSRALVWREVGGTERTDAESFIAKTYREQHGAAIHHFAPRLFALWEGSEIQAAVGARRADPSPLFLESYLQVPIEQALAEALTQPVQRAALAEIGNLATRRPGLAVPLIVSLIETLVAEECRWLAFTATAAVRNGFRRLGLDVRQLAEADPTRLGPTVEEWGNYYLHRPWVMGGDLVAAWHQLGARGFRLPPTTVPAAVSRNKGDSHA
ncbi:thermostable hemolysin [Salinicola rhizosphaerae]|uniref:Thermostable hemolysin n=1 Tax=Salinicola rhizosphaerae TaxID=1443141 RepID=A0ABQ3E332_9GAMM|nr:thermostable hemolysin [Salinicola rhizosphaerae]GHB21885.1 hypothetical protein GCM10009038_20980 [Salinicola rhizosphaerae]